jgi:flagellin
MRINHNISALKINNILSGNDNALSKSLQRLSSGYRINCAADDAAGLAISEKMKTQIAGLNQASRNASDGISVIQTAEGALIEVEEMLQRMRVLSVQAANGTCTDEDRATLQEEVVQLKEEINRISTTTEFNTKKLLNGTVDRRSYSSAESVSLVSLSDSVYVGSYSMNIGNEPSQALLRTQLSSNTAPASGTIYVNDQAIDISEGQSLDQIISALRSGCGDNIEISLTNDTEDPDAPAGYTVIDTNTASSNLSTSYLTFQTKDFGSDSKLSVSCTSSELAHALGISTYGSNASGTNTSVTLYYTNDTNYPDSSFARTATVVTDGNYVTVKDSSGFEMKFCTEGYTGDVTVTVLKAGPMTLQIGANEGQTMEVRIPRIDTVSLEIGDVDISTQSGASEAITVFDKAINIVSSTRAKLGAYQNRLDHAINSLDTSAENLTEALSRVIDTDMASEMSQYTQYQVLVQAATSMLSQANERPQNVLNLLQS